mgnify:CR=1 FL=1
MDRQKEFVLRTLEERDIRFVRLWFTDVLGFLKSVAIAPAELEGAFEEGIGFDGSSIEGFARVSESDTVARPDPSTFQVLPWTTSSGQHHSARMFCDITMPDGSPSWADSRHVLRRQLAKASDLGFSCYVHPEIEFFLLQPGPDDGSVPVPAVHCQPPLLEATSPSMRWRMNSASPSCQLSRRSLVRNEAAIIRARLWTNPVARSWRMAASTTG